MCHSQPPGVPRRTAAIRRSRGSAFTFSARVAPGLRRLTRPNVRNQQSMHAHRTVPLDVPNRFTVALSMSLSSPVVGSALSKQQPLQSLSPQVSRTHTSTLFVPCSRRGYDPCTDPNAPASHFSCTPRRCCVGSPMLRGTCSSKVRCPWARSCTFARWRIENHWCTNRRRST